MDFYAMINHTLENFNLFIVLLVSTFAVCNSVYCDRNTDIETIEHQRLYWLFTNCCYFDLKMNNRLDKIIFESQYLILDLINAIFYILVINWKYPENTRNFLIFGIFRHCVKSIILAIKLTNINHKHVQTTFYRNRNKIKLKILMFVSNN